jgi:hypothetical protein
MFKAIMPFIIKEYVCLDGKFVIQTAEYLSKSYCFIVGWYDEHKIFLKNRKSDHLLHFSTFEPYNPGSV